MAQNLKLRCATLLATQVCPQHKKPNSLGMQGTSETQHGNPATIRDNEYGKPMLALLWS